MQIGAVTYRDATDEYRIWQGTSLDIVDIVDRHRAAAAQRSPGRARSTPPLRWNRWSPRATRCAPTPCERSSATTPRTPTTSPARRRLDC